MFRTTMDLQAEFGDIDIYLFDQLLRGRIAPGMRVLDAGCGAGRNLVFLLRQGYDVCGNDVRPGAVAEARALAQHLAPETTADFRVEAIEDTSFPEAHVDVVLASAVLHFANDHGHFEAMVAALWRVLRPGGLLLARLASTIGIEQQVQPIGNGRHHLPDGSERYLVSAAQLLDTTSRLGAALLDPLKTTVVDQQRAMTTWVVCKAQVPEPRATTFDVRGATDSQRRHYETPVNLRLSTRSFARASASPAWAFGVTALCPLK